MDFGVVCFHGGSWGKQNHASLNHRTCSFFFSLLDEVSVEIFTLSASVIKGKLIDFSTVLRSNYFVLLLNGILEFGYDEFREIPNLYAIYEFGGIINIAHCEQGFFKHRVTLCRDCVKKSRLVLIV